MRKTICILLVLCTLFFIVGCAVGDDVSRAKFKMDNNYYQLGIKALRVIDGYLDSTVSSEDAAASLNSIYRDLERLPEIDLESDTGFGNQFVRSDIALLKIKFAGSYPNGGVSYSDILDLRDDLADLLGKPSYK